MSDEGSPRLRIEGGVLVRYLSIGIIPWNVHRIFLSEEIPSFDLPTTTLPAAMHLRIQYLGAVALIEASKQKELDTIESSVERLRMKQESPEGVNGAARSEN